jgi:hypothetical protein
MAHITQEREQSRLERSSGLQTSLLPDRRTEVENPVVGRRAEGFAQARRAMEDADPGLARRAEEAWTRMKR